MNRTTASTSGAGRRRRRTRLGELLDAIVDEHEQLGIDRDAEWLSEFTGPASARPHWKRNSPLEVNGADPVTPD